jgi:hypothetical protein
MVPIQGLFQSFIVLARNIARIHEKVQTRRFDTKAAPEFIQDSAKFGSFSRDTRFFCPKGGPHFRGKNPRWKPKNAIGPRPNETQISPMSTNPARRTLAMQSFRKAVAGLGRIRRRSLLARVARSSAFSLGRAILGPASRRGAGS